MSLAKPAYAKRDYSLTGSEAQHAIAVGLASAQWYHTDVPRKVMKDLMRRRDQPALRDTLIWIGLLILTSLGGSAVFCRLRRALRLGLRLALARMWPRDRVQDAVDE